MKTLMVVTREARLLLREWGPYMAPLTLPGGYVAGLLGWVARRLPRAVARQVSSAIILWTSRGSFQLPTKDNTWQNQQVRRQPNRCFEDRI
jgi:hypothetical protein